MILQGIYLYFFIIGKEIWQPKINAYLMVITSHKGHRKELI